MVINHTLLTQLIYQIHMRESISQEKGRICTLTNDSYGMSLNGKEKAIYILDQLGYGGLVVHVRCSKRSKSV